MTTTSSELRPFNRLLLTGAAGGLGKVLRQRLRPYANILRLSDIGEMAPAEGPHEEVAVSYTHLDVYKRQGYPGTPNPR